jgi:NAD(P)-dependent dehydrogenase (short-subunit alcohol dehydrogenase family)
VSQLPTPLSSSLAFPAMSPASRPCKTSRARNGTLFGDQSVVCVPHDLACAARDDRKQAGRIINVASAHRLVASPYKSAYVTSKHGIVGLTKVTALEAAERSGV